MSREQGSLADLRTKSRKLATGDEPESVKGLLLEALVEQAYFRGRMDCASDTLDSMKQGIIDADATRLEKD